MLSLEALMQCWHESSCIVKPGERDLAHQLLSDSASAAEGALLFLLPTSKPFLTSGWSSLGFALHAESLSVERCLKRNNLDALTGFRSTAPACWSGRMRCKPPAGRPCCSETFDLDQEVSQQWRSQCASISSRGNHDACCNADTACHHIVDRIASSMPMILIHNSCMTTRLSRFKFSIQENML